MRDLGIVEVVDARFVETGDSTAGASDAVGADVSGLGCAVLAPHACDAQSVCCGAGERCVPVIDGPNRCEPAGAALVGARCGHDGTDDCDVGLLCSDWTAAAGWGVCRSICDSGDPTCPAGEACSQVIETEGERIGVCR